MLVLSSILGLFSLLPLLSAADYTPEALADEVKNLPGAESLDFSFRQFSGYLSISDTKHLHYWFTESSRAPEKDPVAFWTNGGPGCSGLLGFLTEQGPFRPNKDLTLTYNPYSWNTIANTVFIESPCGVGFSYSTDGTGDDYHTDDETTARDNYILIQEFMKRFPQFRSNDLYITSESYGGHYMPTLAKYIVDRNTTGEDDPLNFRGFAVGNPQTTFYSAIPASLDTYWGHQIISKPLWDTFLSTCRNETHRPNLTECEGLFLKMYRSIGDLNPYALDYPVCTESTNSNGLHPDEASAFGRKYGRGQRAWLMNFMMESFRESFSETGFKMLKSHMNLEPVDGYEPCAEDYMTNYLNQMSVKQALHVNTEIDWQDCSRSLRYDQTDGKNSMVPTYKYLIDGKFGLNILVYSGDNDDVCGTIGAQDWIWSMGYKVSGRMWQPYTVNEQTAGYLTQWEGTGFGFATVHSAGHEVPTYKPDIALWLFDAYLKGELTNA